jgi:hypothetical protein
MIDLEPLADEEITRMATQDWLGVLAQLWTAVGKPIDPERLNVYRAALAGVPLGLLELAVVRVLRENQYQVVPLPGLVWEALGKELGSPNDMWMAVEGWVEGSWGRGITNLRNP